MFCYRLAVLQVARKRSEKRFPLLLNAGWEERRSCATPLRAAGMLSFSLQSAPLISALRILYPFGLLARSLATDGEDQMSLCVCVRVTARSFYEDLERVVYFWETPERDDIAIDIAKPSARETVLTTCALSRCIVSALYRCENPPHTAH